MAAFTPVTMVRARRVAVMVAALAGCVVTRAQALMLADVREQVGVSARSRGPALLYCNPGTAVADGPALAAACAAGTQAACVRQGVALATGRGATPAPEQALAVFEQACTAGDRCGCLDVAAVLGLRRDRPSLTRAMALTRTACNEGMARGCAALAVAYRGGISVGDGGPVILPVDPTASHALALRACDASDGVGCYVAAADEASGRGAATDDRAAVQHLQMACDLGVDMACTLEGFALLDGRGVSRDAVQAAERFDRGCSLGDPVGCFALGRLDRDGMIAPADPDRATRAFHGACTGGVYAACLYRR